MGGMAGIQIDTPEKSQSSKWAESKTTGDYIMT